MDRDFKYSGRSAINLELAERYAYSLHDLEKRVANDAAVAARTATQVANMAKTFDGVISPEQKLAFQAAQGAASRLASDLKALRGWASAYSKFKLDKSERERLQKLMVKGHSRWSADGDALVEAEDLLTFFASGESGKEVEAFLLAQHAGWQSFSRPHLYREAASALRALPDAIKRADTTKVRLHTMAVIDELPRSEPHRDVWYAGKDDYEAWRFARATARRAAADALTAIQRTHDGGK